MVSLLRSVLARDNETVQISQDEWAGQWRPGQRFTWNGRAHQAYTRAGGHGGAYEADSIVFACASKRIAVFSEARFQWQQLRAGRPGDLFFTAELERLEQPWPGASTRDLLATAELDILLHGNSYWVRDDQGWLTRLEPSAVKVLTEAVTDPVSGFRIGERLLGYLHAADEQEPTVFTPEQVAHYKPIPSSGSRFVGQSWLSACLPDVDADQLLTEHKRVHLRNGASLSVAVTLDAGVSPDAFAQFVQRFREDHEGPQNAGKTLFLGGGADIKTIGQSFDQLALKATQGATETRIAACAGTPPVIVGLSEGLAGSSLNAGNYAAAKRNFVDSTMRPLWGAFASAVRWLVPAPASARLWYDDRDISFLREDVTAQADILTKDALTIRQLTDAGFAPDAVVEAVLANDVRRLRGEHTGMFSVQLQPPGSAPADDPGGTP